MNAPKCPTGRNLGAHEKGLCDCSKQPARSPMVQAMHMQHGHPKSRIVMKDRRTKRANDARRSWRNEQW
jgi:hypothetical protein